MKLLVCLQLFLFIPTRSSAHFPAHENLSRSYFPSEGIEIKSHPLSQSVCENAEVTLSVEITSPCGVEYQWYRNDVALDGETSATLTFQSGARDDGASFYVAIIGSCGRISSEPAMLSFISRPVISLENATACEGETYTFSASIENAVSYQWYKNSEPIAGTATYVIPSLSEEDAGGYKVNVQVGGDCNYSVGSEEVYLDVRKEVEVVSITESITLCEGETAEMVIEYRGGTEHEWYKNGVPTGIHSNWMEVENPSNGDTYYAVIVGFCNTLVSPEVRLALTPKVSITSDPSPAEVCAGESHTFMVSAQNAVGYQWYFNGEMLPDANSNSYTVSNAGAEQEGVYYVKVFGDGSCSFEAISETVSLSLKPRVGVSRVSSFSGLTVCEGSSVDLQVENTGGGVLQWYRNGEPTTFDSNSITITDAANGDRYHAVVRGGCNTVYSDTVTLALTPKVSITSGPSPAEVCAGESHMFTVSAQNAVGYQWYFNGEMLPDANSNSYTVSNAGAEQEGAYYVKVFGDGSCSFEAISETVSLSLKGGPVIGSQTPSVTVGNGQPFELFVVPVGNFSQVLWYKNNSLTTYTGATIQVSSAAQGDIFVAEVWGDCGSVRSSDIVVTVASASPLTITSTKPAGICQDDSATLSVSGCVEDITWYRGNENVGTGGVYQAFTAGIYSVKCKNSALLADSATIEVADRSVVAYTVSSADVSCFGGTNGSIHIEAEGPVQWVSAPALSGNNPGNLSVGTYHFVVMNSAGCSVSDSVILSQPEKIPVNYSLKNLSCFGSNDGGITIDVSNTHPEPVYKLNGVTGHWSNGHINALIAGTYTIEVQDARGCHLLLPTLVTLSEPERLTFSLIESKEPTGYESTDGYMEVEISGGTGPYTVVWTDETGNSRTSQDYYSGNNLRTRIFNLDKGHYRVNVTDQNPCEATAYYELNAPAPIVITSLADSVTCYGNANGRISLQVEGGVKDGSTIGYQIEWKLEGQTIGSNTLQLAGLKAGTYTVQATDAGGIVASKTIVLGEPAPMSLAVIRLSGNYCSNLAVGEMDLQATGGKLPYTYFYNELESASPLLKGLSGGDYSLRVRDSAGCEAEVTATIENTQQEFKASLTYTQPSCYGACDGTVSAQVMGGIAPFIYQWNEFPGDSATVTGVCAGGETYFTVRDANGCEVSSELLPLSGPAPKTLSLPSELEVCPSDFELDASSLEWGRRFVWTFPDGSSVSGAKVKGDSLGVYRVEVLDQESCGGVGQIRVIARKNVHPMFTLPNEAQTHREVVMIDLSEPYPSAIEWVLPSSATRSAQGDFEARAVFSQTGRFVVRQRATIEGCVYTTSKEIRISDAVPDDGFSPPVSFTDIDFKVLGNPVVHGVLNLEINNPSAESYRVRVFAASGFRKVYEADFTGEKSRNLKISLPEEEADGLFYVTIETPAYRKTRKVLRIK